MKRWPRVMLMLAVWGAIGAGITVAVAWGCACGPVPLGSCVPQGVRDAWPFPLPTEVEGYQIRIYQDSFPRCDVWQILAAKTTANPNSDLAPGDLVGVGGVTFGWPARALGYCGPRASTPWLRPMQTGWLSAGMLVAQLPLYPLWPGFAIDTLLYGTLAWGLWQIPLALRRRRRRAKDLCERCGYNRTGLAKCPECGTVPRG